MDLVSRDSGMSLGDSEQKEACGMQLVIYSSLELSFGCVSNFPHLTQGSQAMVPQPGITWELVRITDSRAHPSQVTLIPQA